MAIVDYAAQLQQYLAEASRMQAQRMAYAQRYSPEAAKADAEGMTNYHIAQTLEKLLPSITRAAEGAGTSANSMRALLTQKAAAQAAGEGATLAAKQQAEYGRILAALMQSDPSMLNAVVGAMGIAAKEISSSQGGAGGGGGSRTPTASFPSSSSSTKPAAKDELFFVPPLLSEAQYQNNLIDAYYGSQYSGGMPTGSILNELWGTARPWESAYNSSSISDNLNSAMSNTGNGSNYAGGDAFISDYTF